MSDNDTSKSTKEGVKAKYSINRRFGTCKVLPSAAAINCAWVVLEQRDHCHLYAV